MKNRRSVSPVTWVNKTTMLYSKHQSSNKVLMKSCYRYTNNHYLNTNVFCLTLYFDCKKVCTV